MPTAKGLLNKFSTAKTLPHIAIKLTKLISDENSTMQDFEKMIKMDPTLVLRLLRGANSPYYGLRQKVNSISRAVVVIGIYNLRNMIVTEGLKEIFKDINNKNAFSRNRLWLHCSAVSICSQMVMERIFGLNGEDAFLCGILHDIGIHINAYNHHKHSAYLIQNLAINGMRNRQVIMCSLIALLHRNKSVKVEWTKYSILLDKEDIRSVKICALFLRIAEMLDRAEDQRIVDIKCQVHSNSILLVINSNNQPCQLEIDSAMKGAEKTRSLLGYDLKIEEYRK